MKFIDLIGKRFGKLTPIKYIGKNKYGKSLLLCKCNCGNEKIIVGSSLKSGHTKSCGCLIKENRGVLKHGHAKRGKESITHRSWSDMLQRCNNPNYKRYQDYGGRGITVCDRWLPENNGFINFLKDMGERPKGKSLDRIENNKGYYPKNCKWSTPKEQCNNKRNNKRN